MQLSTRTYVRAFLAFLSSTSIVTAGHPFRQFDTPAFVNYFDSLTADSYAQVDAVDSLVPASCRYGPGFTVPIPSDGNGTVITVTSEEEEVSAATVQSQCSDVDGNTNTDIICVIPAHLILVMDASLVVYALVIRGQLKWDDSSSSSSGGQRSQWLCAGYIAVEDAGRFDMTVQDTPITAWIYLSNNGAHHPLLGTRAFGATGTNNPTIQIKGRELTRTWSLLQVPLAEGDTVLRLAHDPVQMGWKVGDRIAVAPTDDRSQGDAQSFIIVGFERGRLILLDKMSIRFHDASVIPGTAISKRAEVINLSRNIIISGDDFEEVPCDSTLTEAYPGFGTSTEGCMCSPTRQSCTVGLHTIHMYSGVSKIENVRVEKCGQRGIEGKYCLHLHHMEDCPDCLFRNNAVEFSVQRGLIVHSTHRSVSDANVFYDVRGVSIYIEDGNEMENVISNNVGICPWHFETGGCTLPGTSNDQGDTSLNQAGIYLESPNNHLIGNRMANHFNGMLLNAGDGRGPVEGLVCDQRAPLGRWESNVFHSSGRFGTYTLHQNYPVKNTGMSIASNGQTDSCEAFTSDGSDNGLVVTISNNMDYGNAFVGHYEAGDIQYNGHSSFGNLNNIYWKETKSFADGCSSHIVNSHFLNGTMALPDSLGSFIFEHTTLEGVLMEANHHCGEGGTGYLCMPHYVLHQVNWIHTDRLRWVTFKEQNTAYQGGIFSLSPDDALLNTAATGGFFLPQSYQSLVSPEFYYLLGTGKCDSSESLGLGARYEQGILCNVPLRTMKIYSQNGGGDILLQVWDAAHAVPGGSPLSEQTIPFYGINAWKQGYKFPVIPGSDFFYKVSLNGGDVPSNWIIDFGDRTITNRWGVDELRVEIQGRECNGTIRSDHDRQFITADIDKMVREGLGWGRGACTSFSPMPLIICPEQRPPSIRVPEFTIEPTFTPTVPSPSTAPSLRASTESPSLVVRPPQAQTTITFVDITDSEKPVDDPPLLQQLSNNVSLTNIPEFALASSTSHTVWNSLCPVLFLAFAASEFVFCG